MLLNKKLFLFYLLLIGSLRSYTQNKVDSISITEADIILNKVLNRDELGCEYMIYSLSKKFICISKKETDFEIIFIEPEAGVVYKKTYKKIRVLRRVFKDKSYDKKFVYSDYFNRSFETHPHSNYFYFRLILNCNKKCEFNFPVLAKEKNDGEILKPIPKKIHEFLLNIYLNFWYRPKQQQP